MNAVTNTDTSARTAPVKATWVCLIIAWVLFLLPIPGAGLFIGWPLNLVGFILAIVVMARGFTSKGLIPLLASIIVSPIVYFVGLAVLGAAALGGSSFDEYKARAESNAKPAPAQVASADAIKVTARELFRAYDANEIAADSQFKGKLVQVSGEVGGISSDLSDEPVIELVAGDFKSVHAKGLPKGAAAQLAKGMTVTLNCTGNGEVIGMPMLDDCVLQ